MHTGHDQAEYRRLAWALRLAIPAVSLGKPSKKLLDYLDEMIEGKHGR